MMGLAQQVSAVVVYRDSLADALATGQVRLGELFGAADAPVIAGTKLVSLLPSHPDMGKVTTNRLLERLGIDETVLLGELSLEEQGLILSSVEGSSGRIVVVSGPSGVGKSSVIGGLGEVAFSVSATTRPPRSGEVDGEHYFFLSDEEFDQQVASGEMLEWATYAGFKYGTPAGAVDAAVAAGKTVVLDIENDGAHQVKAVRPGSVLVFLAPPSIEDLRERLEGRGDTPADMIERRLAVAAEQISDAESSFEWLVGNDDLSRATAQVKRILSLPLGR